MCMVFAIFQLGNGFVKVRLPSRSEICPHDCNETNLSLFDDSRGMVLAAASRIAPHYIFSETFPVECFSASRFIETDHSQYMLVAPYASDCAYMNVFYLEKISVLLNSLLSCSVISPMIIGFTSLAFLLPFF